MNKMLVLGVTLFILLVTIFLISHGTYNDVPELWWTGLLLIGFGGLVPPVTRFAYADEEEKEKDE